ncbi:diaminopimelate epimerase [Magnetospirillum sulfuroxidans]|uniref:Diaminopimelate epimerase n=1 Tax=Magnetospirillum sulfuroxidans TaxID=611300 RepID=A0ABS5IEX5_9PROT|nr:diaminopimelate epimerase [Magnetospirillum sulfuroxidans]MBR9972323.1 diaminopimelate epimerase [Magnetospirillum sulfuroxidans]
MTDINGLPFLKMHGLGNDFVVLDVRDSGFALTSDRARAIADRRTGIGCDQVVVIEPARSNLSDAWMSLWNADGSETAACGNATRCVAWLLMQAAGIDRVVIETKAGLLDAESRGGRMVAVDMGPARLDWRELPLAKAVDTLNLGIGLGALQNPVGVSMGNPHAVFFVDDVAAIDLAVLGPVLEHHDIFPERANIEAAQVLGPDRIRMRVWERGTGITSACGTGACATLVAAARRGLTGRKADVVLDGGALTIEWLPDDHVLMTGPVALVAEGRLDSSLLS